MVQYITARVRGMQGSHGDARLSCPAAFGGCLALLGDNIPCLPGTARGRRLDVATGVCDWQSHGGFAHRASWRGALASSPGRVELADGARDAGAARGGAGVRVERGQNAACPCPPPPAVTPPS
jgi:hypothetical protein